MNTSSPAVPVPFEPAGARVFNPWLIALAVVVPTFMEVLDTTIANVALRYIAGGLSAAATDSEWVITSYLAANAIILPISGWLAASFGTAQLFSALHRCLYHQLHDVRHGDESPPVDLLPGAARSRRRWSSTLQPGDSAG